VDFDLPITIRRPPSAVFALLVDPQDYGDHTPSSVVPVLEKLPPGPTRPGTRWHEVVRLGPGMRMTIWSEVTAVEPDHRLRERYWSSWMRGTLEYTVEPVADATLLRMLKTLTPKGPFRLLERPIASMLRPREVERLEEIRDLLEADAAGKAPDERVTDASSEAPRSGEGPR